MAKCVVIGGGLSGLSTAYLLSRLSSAQVSHVHLYEGNASHFGGCIMTARNPQTGALQDLGPHSARIAGAHNNPLMRMVSSLGFSRDELHWLPQAPRYIYAAGGLRPISLFSPRTQPPFSRPHIAMFIRRALQRGPGPLTKDISVDEFLRTRFDDEFADLLGTAMIRGIVGVDSKRISVSALLPQVGCMHVVYCLVICQTCVS